MTSGGSVTSLYSFCSQPKCTDGRDPIGGLVQGRDGNFYGTTWWGGATNHGTVFAITSSGSLSKLYDFCSQSTCTDGHYAGLVQASDGNFYGVTKEGATNCTSDGGCGVAFKLQASEDTLTVSAVGSGTVTSTDGFINCPGTCTHLYSQRAGNLERHGSCDCQVKNPRVSADLKFPTFAEREVITKTSAPPCWDFEDWTAGLGGRPRRRRASGGARLGQHSGFAFVLQLVAFPLDVRSWRSEQQPHRRWRWNHVVLVDQAVPAAGACLKCGNGATP